MVLEVGRRLAGRVGQRDPQLQAAQGRRRGRGRLGVGDAAAGGHQVERAGPDELLAAEAVLVEHLAAEQPGDGLQAGVRVRRHDHAGVGVGRAVVVEEAPGADGADLAVRQGPADHEGADAAEGDLARDQHLAGGLVADRGQPAGGRLLRPALQVAHTAERTTAGPY